MLEIPRDLPPAADPVGARGAAEDLRRHSWTVFRPLAAVRVRWLSAAG